MAEAYQILKDLDVHLVTSGHQEIKISARNFKLNNKEWFTLLRAATISLAMSKFKEGWNKAVHEAMYLRTPVIGSGQGGMRELLTGGKQIICSDFNLLRKNVEYLLNNDKVRIKMGEDGYNYAKNFTFKKFEKDWVNVINSLCQEQ